MYMDVFFLLRRNLQLVINYSYNSLDLFRPPFLSCVNLQGKSHESAGTNRSNTCQSLPQSHIFYRSIFGTKSHYYNHVGAASVRV